MPKALRALASPWLVGYLAIYGAFLALLRGAAGFPLEEPLFIFAVLGVGFSLLALWTTRGLMPRVVPVRRIGPECGALAILLAGLTAFITWGLPAVRASSADSMRSAAAVLAAKLAAFAVVPFLVWRLLFGYSVRDFTGRPPGLSGFWRPVLWLSGAALAFQLVFGRAPAQLHAHPPQAARLAVGLPLAFLWLAIEAGLVEEFFFRALLQTRLSALLGTEVGAIALTSVLFGLAHSPGLYLRPDATGEAIGGHPSLLLAVGYTIVLTSVAGWFLGILWARTRSLAAVVAVHAAMDLLPDLVELLRAWGWA
jgi:membrane protease YdiL (CAAX protease family)